MAGVFPGEERGHRRAIEKRGGIGDRARAKDGLALVEGRTAGGGCRPGGILVNWWGARILLMSYPEEGWPVRDNGAGWQCGAWCRCRSAGNG